MPPYHLYHAPLQQWYCPKLFLFHDIVSVHIFFKCTFFGCVLVLHMIVTYLVRSCRRLAVVNTPPPAKVHLSLRWRNGQRGNIFAYNAASHETLHWWAKMNFKAHSLAPRMCSFTEMFIKQEYNLFSSCLPRICAKFMNFCSLNSLR